ncbi:MAG: class I SAM-dependent methyltransferase [Actinomycetota bacterium]|jgi:ubiquinone/menaquinone biosynthesis C-methylase UbiE|nr:class I SAM-dependent methyltransferase [Acidothermales bacterium]MDQ3430883.1 class I SAM-dependent methyltransferase [Actinomycetota bacterium]
MRARGSRRDHPVFTHVYAALAALGERGRIGELRGEVLRPASGRLLVVGLGPGYDLDHVPETVDAVVAVEPSPSMSRRATRRVIRLQARGVPVHMVSGTAEALPLRNDSVDTVLCAFVLCSVTDLTRALAEVRRVLHAEGCLLLLEHVRGEEDSRLAALQDRVEPLWGRLAGGCHPNRDVRAALRAAGFDAADVVDFPLAQNVPLCRPHLRGRANLR